MSESHFPGLNRRDLMRMAVALPAAHLFEKFRAMAAPNLKRVKITNIRAMAIKNIAIAVVKDCLMCRFEDT